MSEKVYCHICTAPMKLKERVKSNKRYRIRRMICVNGHERTIWADGRDEIDNTNKIYETNSIQHLNGPGNHGRPKNDDPEDDQGATGNYGLSVADNEPGDMGRFSGAYPIIKRLNVELNL